MNKFGKLSVLDFANWSLTFTKKLIVFVTIIWSLSTLYSAALMLYAISTVGDFSFLDTFINDNGETFRLIVGANLISKTVENVFHYNNGGIFGTSIKEDDPEAEIKPEESNEGEHL